MTTLIAALVRPAWLAGLQTGLFAAFVIRPDRLA